MGDEDVRFAVIGVDHEHIHTLCNGMLSAGARLAGWWTKDEPAPPLGRMAEENVLTAEKRVLDRAELLDDSTISVVLIGAMAGDRATYSLEAITRGKDVLSDKPGALRQEEVDRLRKATSETGRKWIVNFSERYLAPAAIRAGQLVHEGRIGVVLQTVGLGPHKATPARRPQWFFDSALNGGIINNLGSHQIDQFMFFTGSNEAEVVASRVANLGLPEHQDYEDFGEVMLRGDKGSGYARVDFLSPESRHYPGDIRTIVYGTSGQIEFRRYVKLPGRSGTEHLMVMNEDGEDYIDCSDVKIEFFDDFVRDVRERTETAARQDHSLAVTELAIRAQRMAASTHPDRG